MHVRTERPQKFETENWKPHVYRLFHEGVKEMHSFSGWNGETNAVFALCQEKHRTKLCNESKLWLHEVGWRGGTDVIQYPHLLLKSHIRKTVGEYQRVFQKRRRKTMSRYWFAVQASSRRSGRKLQGFCLWEQIMDVVKVAHKLRFFFKFCEFFYCRHDLEIQCSCTSLMNRSIC